MVDSRMRRAGLDRTIHVLPMTAHDRNRQWGFAWMALAIAVALHVMDEAMTGFLPLYNSVVESLRDSYLWIPLPTFSFSVWITGLSIGVLLLLALSPLVFAGNRISGQLHSSWVCL